MSRNTRSAVALVLIAGLALTAATAQAAGPAGVSVGVLASPDEPGQRIVLHGLVQRVGRPAVGAEVHAYQADAGGLYDKDGGPGAPGSRLSATVRTDAEGRFSLRTILPGRYPQAAGASNSSPPAHVHLVIRGEGFAEHRSEVLFAVDPALQEPRWQSWARQSGYPVVALTADGETSSGTFFIDLP